MSDTVDFRTGLPKRATVQSDQSAALARKKAISSPAVAPSTAPQIGVVPIARTSIGLRDALFDEIDKFRAGNGDIERATAIAKLASHIVQLARLEYDVRANPLKDDATSTVLLGTPKK